VNTVELKKAFVWGVGLGFGFAVAGWALGLFKRI